jgi:hypothetical protein
MGNLSIKEKITFTTLFDYNLCKNTPNYLYIFGENEKQYNTNIKGGGQAIIRPLPNSYGFRVQENIGIYWKDVDFEKNKAKIDEDVENIKLFSINYDKIVFPFSGIGTGRALMLENCPQTFFYMCYKLQKEFGFNNIMSFENKKF